MVRLVAQLRHDRQYGGGSLKCLISQRIEGLGVSLQQLSLMSDP